MVRIADIYRKQHAEPEPLISVESAAPPAPSKLPSRDVPAQAQPHEDAAAGMVFSREPELGVQQQSAASAGAHPIVEMERPLREKAVRDSEDADSVYAESLVVVREFYGSVRQERTFFDARLYEQIRVIAGLIARGNDRILSLTNRITIPDYLYSHVLNVCILAIKLGQAIGLSSEQIIEVGLAALFHDLGLLRKTALIMKVEKLTAQEIEAIKQHSEEGRRLIVGMNFISDELKRLIAEVVYQCHERENGFGYPRGVKGAHLHRYAQIIGLLDTYEALCHHRTYRGRFLPHDVCRWLIEGRDPVDEFDARLIKKFIESVGLYPLGSYVRLSSGEVAEVTRINADYPLKPEVDIIIDIQGEMLRPPKKVDLIHNPVLQIVAAVDETALTINDRRFALFLLTRNWVILD